MSAKRAVELYGARNVFPSNCALLRVAGFSAFVDFSPGCCQTVRDNLKALGVEDRGQAVESDALRALLDPRAAGIEVSEAMSEAMSKAMGEAMSESQRKI